MTSKAERKRNKRAARKILQHQVHAEPAGELEVARPPVLDPFQDTSSPLVRARLMTDRQEIALSWFCNLRRDGDAGGSRASNARPQIEAVRSELSADEFSILSEICRSAQPINGRVGRSRQTVREIEMSALRKLVIYRASNGIGEETDA